MSNANKEPREDDNLQQTDGEELPTVAHGWSVERGAAPGYSKATA